ncbi:MAG: ATP-dependent Clp protease proteolytic subunit [Treponemataceae bacterium]
MTIFNEEKKTDEKQNTDPMLEKFLETRQILLSDEINKDLAEKVIKNFLILEAMSKTKPIYLYINSPGGDVDAGFAIFDIIRFIQPKVISIGTGLIASAAAFILLATKKENRFGLPNSRYLIHQPLSKMQGVATDIEIHAQEIEKAKNAINKVIADETGTPLKKVASDTDRDYWLDAEEACKYGLISKVITSRKDLPKV